MSAKTEHCEVADGPGKLSLFRFDTNEAAFRIDPLDDRGIEITWVRNKDYERVWISLLGRRSWQVTRACTANDAEAEIWERVLGWLDAYLSTG